MYVDSVLPTEQVRWIILWQHVRVQVLCINTCITCTISTDHVSIYTTKYILKSIMDFLSYTGQLTKKILRQTLKEIWLGSKLLTIKFSASIKHKFLFFLMSFILHNESNDITVHFLVNLWKNEWNHQPADVLIAPLPGVGLTIQTYNKKE